MLIHIDLALHIITDTVRGLHDQDSTLHIITGTVKGLHDHDSTLYIITVDRNCMRRKTRCMAIWNVSQKIIHNMLLLKSQSSYAKICFSHSFELCFLIKNCLWVDYIFQSLSDTKTSVGPDEVKKAAFNLILVSLYRMVLLALRSKWF